MYLLKKPDKKIGKSFSSAQKRTEDKPPLKQH